MASAKPEQCGRAEQLTGRVGEALGQLRQGAHRVLPLRACNEDADEVPVRRITELASALELTGQEAFDVLAHGECHGPRLGLERLDEHPTRRVAAAAPR